MRNVAYSSGGVIFSRAWEMPNSRTYSVKCIESLIKRYIPEGSLSIDPFANTSRMASITNDLDPSCGADHNLDASDFLNLFGKDSVDHVLFDPPYSPRQVSECYKKMGMTVNMETTQSSFWRILKDKISNIVKPGGMVISFGWNTNGMGINRGFELIEVMMVAHGGAHNDTIVTVERKFQSTMF